jgi:DNA-binding MarR family transcriptional regulator
MSVTQRRAKSAPVGQRTTRVAEPDPRAALGKGYFPHSLSRVLNLLNLQLLEWLRPHGATVQQFRVMQVVAVLGVASIGEIAQDAVIEQPVVSRIVDQLEARDFARRRKRPTNGRVVEVTLTRRGIEVFRTVSPHAYEIVRNSLAVLNDAEKATIEELLTRIFLHLQDRSPIRSTPRAPEAQRPAANRSELRR